MAVGDASFATRIFLDLYVERFIIQLNNMHNTVKIKDSWESGNTARERSKELTATGFGLIILFRSLSEYAPFD